MTEDVQGQNIINCYLKDFKKTQELCMHTLQVIFVGIS